MIRNVNKKYLTIFATSQESGMFCLELLLDGWISFCAGG
jgi:hypothetical protein